MLDKVILKGLTRKSTNEEIWKAAFDLVWEIRFIAMATVRKGMPQARIFDMTLLDDGNIYFVTATGKPTFDQLQANPNIVITGVTYDWLAVRVNAKVVETIDPVIKEKFLEKNQGTKSLYSKSPDALRYFRLEKGEGEITHLYQDDMVARLRFGWNGVNPRPFVYCLDKEKCIACGVCFNVCVGKAIRLGEKYSIDYFNCLECGSCYRNCPEQAISKESE
jgi:uncharacterized pyridoxamine 5'-phosphate oxidase family protein/Pyruvate/2-oxoacid:ferredoxin oxidoreductase delta subunit